MGREERAKERRSIEGGIVGEGGAWDWAAAPPAPLLVDGARGSLAVAELTERSKESEKGERLGCQ